VKSTDLQPGQIVLMDGEPHLVENVDVEVHITLQRIEPLGDRFTDILDGQTPEPFSPVFCILTGKQGDPQLRSPHLTLLSPEEIT
jgi:hypothetical protein